MHIRLSLEKNRIAGASYKSLGFTPLICKNPIYPRHHIGSFPRTRIIVMPPQLLEMTIFISTEREGGLEPPTLGLCVQCSATELLSCRTGRRTRTFNLHPGRVAFYQLNYPRSEARRSRTSDLRIFSPMLSQLSYCPV